MSAATDLSQAARVCFFAHYDRFGEAADHVLLYLDALAEAGFAVVVLSTATFTGDARARLAAHCHTLVERANVGLDFGGWAEAVARFFPLTAELLLLANDSVYAPVGSLAAFVERLIAVPADVYGAVESQEHAPHLQSWFVLLRPAAYESTAFAAFMAAPVDLALDKGAIVLAREVRLTQILDDAGLVRHAAYGSAQAGPIIRHRPINPTHLLWRELIERHGIPFVKVDLLRLNPVRVTSATEWRAVVAPRNTALATAIARDLDRFPLAATGSWRERLAWSVDRFPTYWPEMAGFLARDDRLARRLALAQVNDGVYRLVEAAGKVARRLARMRRDARPRKDVP